MKWVSFNSDVLLILAYRLSRNRHFLLKKLPQGLETSETDPAVAHVRPQNFLPIKSLRGILPLPFQKPARSLQGSAIEEPAAIYLFFQERTRKQISNEPALRMFPVTSTVKSRSPFLQSQSMGNFFSTRNHMRPFREQL